MSTACLVSIDRITRLAAKALRVPLVAVSPLDERLENADVRLCIPLHRPDGQAIGALCAIDTQPHDFSAEDLATLSEFARLVEEATDAKERALLAEAALERAQKLQARNLALRHQISRALVSERAQYRAEQRLRIAHAQLEIANARLQLESTTDYLTGIANRRVFCERADQAAKDFRACGQSYGLILIDLDDFKLINDTFGHEIGDQVLSTVGSVLKRHLCARVEVCARIGGEEFAVLCFGRLHEESIRHLAESIRNEIAQETVQSTRGVVKFSCSLGLALSHSEDAGWKDIYARADTALYEAKASGKNRAVYGRSYLKGATGRFKSLRMVSND
jgi:diguanylate cyclase (GGDEF)-like protein